MCLPPPSSEESEEDSRSVTSNRGREVEAAETVTKAVFEDVFTSESENSSVATCRTVRRIDPATGEVVSLSPSGSLSFGSNLSLTVSEGDNCHRDKPLASGVQGKHSVPVRTNKDNKRSLKGNFMKISW